MLIWEGPSRINGEPIIAIATFGSQNRKTGDMVQVWILPRDIKPTKAVKSGADEAVCGDCKHRGTSCYVNVGQAPLTVWRKYHRGGYPEFDPEAFRGKAVRFGAYGDPAAVPVKVWETLAELADTHTGYTHQWKRFPELKPYCMASVDDEEEYQQAKTAGWRTFRVMPTGGQTLEKEFLCPSDRGVKCANCTMCDGATANDKRRDIAIHVHGSKGRVNAFNRLKIPVVVTNVASRTPQKYADSMPTPIAQSSNVLM